ncbi:MAG TPA: hypothetical protein VFE62_07515 [Gemmataceae bacterium]|nr:hypothetical protein [Gemmataceae bacterium]
MMKVETVIAAMSKREDGLTPFLNCRTGEVRQVRDCDLALWLGEVPVPASCHENFADWLRIPRYAGPSPEIFAAGFVAAAEASR